MSNNIKQVLNSRIYDIYSNPDKDNKYYRVSSDGSICFVNVPIIELECCKERYTSDPVYGKYYGEIYFDPEHDCCEFMIKKKTSLPCNPLSTGSRSVLVYDEYTPKVIKDYNPNKKSYEAFYIIVEEKDGLLYRMIIE